MINTSNIWQFSASSKSQLGRCLAAAQFDSHNKWIHKFKISPTAVTHENDKQVEEIEIDTDSIDHIMEVDDRPLETAKAVENEQHIMEFLHEVVDGDPTLHFNKIVEMCMQDKSVYSLLLNNLSALSLQKLCNHIFSSKDVNREFIESFYEYFLPVYLKREHTWLSLDILVKAKECHGKQFRSLLLILLNEKDFPSKILQEFVSTLDMNELSFFTTSIVDYDISNDMFLHHLFTIFLAYKECHKDDNVQYYILKKLTQLSDACSTDKNYGRLLLTFIQNSKSIDNLAVLEKLVDTHRSAFKRPCLNALSNLR